jgi:hypothetical protein
MSGIDIRSIYVRMVLEKGSTVHKKRNTSTPNDTSADETPFLVTLHQCSSKCGTRTTGGTQKDFKGYAEENKLLRIVPVFCLLSDNSNIK